MTTVIFRVAHDTISGIEPSRRIVVATPTRARWADKTLVIPDEVRFTMPAEGESVNVILDDTGDGLSWAWKITYPGQRAVYVLVPDADNPIEAADLVQVDPATLEPDATPEPAWWASVTEQVIGAEVIADDLILTRQNGDTLNAGNVRGPKGDKGDKGDKGVKGDPAVKAIIPDPSNPGFFQIEAFAWPPLSEWTSREFTPLGDGGSTEIDTGGWYGGTMPGGGDNVGFASVTILAEAIPVDGLVFEWEADFSDVNGLGSVRGFAMSGLELEHDDGILAVMVSYGLQGAADPDDEFRIVTITNDGGQESPLPTVTGTASIRLTVTGTSVVVYVNDVAYELNEITAPTTAISAAFTAQGKGGSAGSFRHRLTPA